jgi:hypothetical protein
MSTRSILSFLILMTLLTVMASIDIADENFVDSLWAQSPMRIDGFTLDWADTPVHRERQIKTEYAFMNDDENLYILLTLHDLGYVNQIRLTGLTIWLNKGNSKAKEMGVRFLTRMITADEMIKMLEKSEHGISDSQKEAIRKKGPYITNQGSWIDKKLKGIKVTGQVESLKPPIYRASVSSNSVTYEMRIPLGIKELWGEGEKDLSQILKVGFEWGGSSKEMKEALMRQRAELSSQASSSETEFRTRDSGGDTAQVAGDMNLPFKRFPPKRSFWVNVVLSKTE